MVKYHCPQCHSELLDNSKDFFIVSDYGFTEIEGKKGEKAYSFRCPNKCRYELFRVFDDGSLWMYRHNERPTYIRISEVKNREGPFIGERVRQYY